MKIKLVGKNLDDNRPILSRFGFEETPGNDAELIIAHGGDGTMLEAERLYPGIPKLPLRDAGTAPLCRDHANYSQLQKFISGKATASLLPKLAGIANGRTLYGINDIFVHNRERVSALRYRVWIDDELYANEIVGDGAGVSTVHGSTAYYRSITHSIFKVGLGLAFSNCTASVDHLVVSDKSVIELEIVRGPGIMVADNAPDTIELNEGDRIKIFQTGEYAKIFNLADFMCPACRLLRHPHLYEDKVFNAAWPGRGE